MSRYDSYKCPTVSGPFTKVSQAPCHTPSFLGARTSSILGIRPLGPGGQSGDQGYHQPLLRTSHSVLSLNTSEGIHPFVLRKFLVPPVEPARASSLPSMLAVCTWLPTPPRVSAPIRERGPCRRLCHLPAPSQVRLMSWGCTSGAGPVSLACLPGVLPFGQTQRVLPLSPLHGLLFWPKFGDIEHEAPGSWVPNHHVTGLCQESKNRVLSSALTSSSCPGAWGLPPRIPARNPGPPSPHPCHGTHSGPPSSHPCSIRSAHHASWGEFHFSSLIHGYRGRGLGPAFPSDQGAFTPTVLVSVKK